MESVLSYSAFVLATASFIRVGTRTRDWREAYDRFRSNLGRGILLGLELLVGADIISTTTARLPFKSVGLLAGIVAIWTFLSFSLETEVEGCWPWERPNTPPPWIFPGVAARIVRAIARCQAS